jgi:hypothetical protein
VPSAGTSSTVPFSDALVLSSESLVNWYTDAFPDGVDTVRVAVSDELTTA